MDSLYSDKQYLKNILPCHMRQFECLLESAVCVEKCSGVKCSESLSNRVSNVIRRYRSPEVRCFYGFLFIIFLHVLLGFFFKLYTWFTFCILLFNSVSYVFLLLCLCIFIVMYAPFCIFCFHHANWQSSATVTEVFPCFFLSCKAYARV